VISSQTTDEPESEEELKVVSSVLTGFEDDSDATERAIPIRPADLVRLLTSDPSLSPSDRAEFLHFARILGATLHHEYYDWLNALKDLYSPLDPDSDCAIVEEGSREFHEDADEAFLKPFEAALIKANYRPLNLDVIAQAISSPNEIGLNYVPDFSIFEHLRVYVRGRVKVSRITRTLKSRFRKVEKVFDGYARMVVLLKFRPNAKKLDNYARPEVVYLRLFKDVPHVDMEMHLPEQGTKVKMRMIDKAQIASPMLTGIPMLIAKVFFMGVNPLAFGFLVAPLTAGVNSFFGFQRAKQKHLAYMIRHLYYLTLANNASVVNRLVDCAEEEEFKEALLAYYFLWRGEHEPEPWDTHRLDTSIEEFVQEKTGLEIDFEIGDALRKLIRYGIVDSDGQGRLHPVPIRVALDRLDHQWDDAFRHRREPRNPPEL